jgi:hypothetical protein
VTEAARIAMDTAAAASAPAGRGRHHRHGALSFQQVLARAHRDSVAGHMPASRTVFRAGSAAGSDSRPARTLPADAEAALSQAMTLENVPDSWKPGLSFIMAQESGGRVDARNPVHSARGLFQLTRANWHLNPHGAASFGNAVEEAQGGIRYIQARYGTADRAVAFWRQHHWY